MRGTEQASDREAASGHVTWDWVFGRRLFTWLPTHRSLAGGDRRRLLPPLLLPPLLFAGDFERPLLLAAELASPLPPHSSSGTVEVIGNTDPCRMGIWLSKLLN